MAKGMLVDTSICIGCKACQVACKQWNDLPGDPADFQIVDGHLTAVNFTGDSYDNTSRLSATNWRHVRFIENIPADRSSAAWYMMSDSCKHCVQAGCLDVCPTHALTRSELGNVYVQPDVCNGCRACIAACPFGVISFNRQTGVTAKCTLCEDRIHQGLPTACAKACPTGSIAFGDVQELQATGRERAAALKQAGYQNAVYYGDTDILGGLNVSYVLQDDPRVYGLPLSPKRVQRNLVIDSALSIGAAIVVGLATLAAFRMRRSPAAAEELAREEAE